MSKYIELYYGFQTPVAKLLNYDKIPSHVADQNYIAFID